MIKFDDFAKLDLRVAKIIAAERLPDTDKLLRLLVKVGKEERTLVAGIAKSYAPSEVIGRSIVIVANLEPRKLRGIESQSMLLAAEGTDGGFALVTVDGEVEDGAKVG